MRLDVFLFMCIFMCLCVVFFDLIFTTSVWSSKYVASKRSKYLYDILCSCIKDAESSKKQIKKLKRLLSHEGWLLPYLNVYNNFAHQNKHLQVKETLDCNDIDMLNIYLFNEISEQYVQKNNEYKALFSSIVYRLMHKSGENVKHSLDIEELSKVLISYLNSNSVFVRGNAFRALVKISRNQNDIFYALTQLNDSLQIRDSKIFSDYLLEYDGNAVELVGLILENIHEFSTEVQIMVLDYMRHLPKESQSESYCRAIIELLNDPSIDGETVLAIIRYFEKHFCVEAYEILYKYLEMDNDTKAMFNYSAVAAKALRNYPSQKTNERLIGKLSSKDWFVRFNSADSLLYLNVDYEKIIENTTDNFASDILVGRAAVQNMKKRKRHAL